MHSGADLGKSTNYCMHLQQTHVSTCKPKEKFQDQSFTRAFLHSVAITESETDKCVHL